jgi:hypothetical protein
MVISADSLGRYGSLLKIVSLLFLLQIKLMHKERTVYSQDVVTYNKNI